MVDEIANHYSRGSNIVSAIAGALQKAGKDPCTLTSADLAAVDEFHSGGDLPVLPRQ